VYPPCLSLPTLHEDCGIPELLSEIGQVIEDISRQRGKWQEENERNRMSQNRSNARDLDQP